MRCTAPRGSATFTIVIILIAVIVLIAAVFLLNRSTSENAGGSPDLFVVRSGGFDITVPASGELAAMRQKEIASSLDTRAVITYIVEEGKFVREGDVLIRLQDEDITNRIKDAEDTVNTAETAWITAQSNLEIKRQEHTSAIDEADLEVRLAELALKAWEEGEAVSTRKKLELEEKTARKDYERLVDRFEASKVLLDQEFISEDEYRRDEISMLQAEARLEQAQLAITVYEDYQHEQERAVKESDLQQAKDRRERLEKRHANEIKSLETEVESKQFQYESRTERLEDYRRQLGQCTIIAPQDGLVVYASSLDSGGHRGRDEEPPQVGTELPRNRTVMILPDTSQMVAEVKVNEALTGKIEKGQKAVIYSDALPDHAIPGEVISMGVLAQTGGWRDPNRRDYSVRILLSNGEGLDLKPSMRCKADIYVGRVDGALYVPIQGVFRKGPIAFVYTPDGAGYAPRPVTLGRSSELYIEILDGLTEGDAVLLREPPPDRITAQLDVPETPFEDMPLPGMEAGEEPEGMRGGPPEGMRPASPAGRSREGGEGMRGGQRGESPDGRPGGMRPGQRGDRPGSRPEGMDPGQRRGRGSGERPADPGQSHPDGDE